MVHPVIAPIAQVLGQAANQEPSESALRKVGDFGKVGLPTCGQIKPRHRRALIADLAAQISPFPSQGHTDPARKGGVGVFDDIVQNFGQDDLEVADLFGGKCPPERARDQRLQ